MIDSPACISPDDGRYVYTKIEQLMRDEKNITVSFENATMLTSLFLSVAIGQLHGTFDEQTIRNQLRVEGLVLDGRELLKRVVDNAKTYNSNKEAYDAALKKQEDENEE